MLATRRVGLGLLVMGVGIGFLEIIGLLQAGRSPAGIALATAGIIGAVLWPVGAYVMMRPGGSRRVVLTGLGLLITVETLQLVTRPTNQMEQFAFLVFLALCFLSAVIAH